MLDRSQRASPSRTPNPGDRIKVSVRLHDGQAVVAVTGSGCGIPPTDLGRIFGRFARAQPYRSREAGGFGLGLPIVQAITETHHGAIRVHSASGHGATFELVIPAVPELTPAGNSAEPQGIVPRPGDGPDDRQPCLARHHR